MDRRPQNAVRFAHDRQGSVSVIFAVACIALFLMIGVAVDSSRFYNVGARMQDALDAAALAGAKMLPDDKMSDTDIHTIVQKHFDASMSTAGVVLTTLQPLNITVDRPNTAVNASMNASVKSLFGGLAHLQKIAEINKSSRVVFDAKKVELSLVLDITGSMNTNNKLADMKIAAKDVIDELMNASHSEDSIRIALAPYSASVNAGALASAVTNVPPTTNCVYKKHEWKCTDVSGVDQDTCVIERTGVNATTDAAPVGPDALPNVPSTPYGNYVCPAATVLPLQGKSNKDELKDTIDSYAASGSTAGHIGTAWGWYLVSPDWASVLPAASAPKPYDPAVVTKAVVIMTDGLFNTSYISGPSSDLATQSNESYAQFQALCSGMKGKNVTVYTVGYDLADPRAMSELQSCASGVSNFFDAKTGADLKKAFKAIADKLNTLRVAG